MDYDRRILNALLDTYENSLLSREENKVTIHITFRFTRKSMPEYYDESSMEFEAIHACLQELENREFLTVEWQNGVKGHIVQKVILREEHAKEIYRYLNRTPRAVHEHRQEQVLDRLAGECTSPVASAFLDWLRERLAQRQPVKEYIEMDDPGRTERLIRCVWYVETNPAPCYLREFSILHFADSKAFEGMAGTVRKIFCRFGEGMKDADEKEIFAEYGIYDTPNYVYLKGEGVLRIQSTDVSTDVDSMEGRTVILHPLRQGIGISGEDLENVYVNGTEETNRVITIENLTTFFRFQEAHALIIYLGGYHNRTRRRLLKMIHEQLPDAEYLHFGDIDAGGFAIYEDLCRKTGIAFRPYRMGIGELERYRPYGKKLTAGDRQRIGQMLEEPTAHLDLYRGVLQYMLAHDCKLEQECIGLDRRE